MLDQNNCWLLQVPDYAMTFVKGTSSKYTVLFYNFIFISELCIIIMVYLSFNLCRPFGRLWWDETVPTVVTRAEPHNQVAFCSI